VFAPLIAVHLADGQLVMPAILGAWIVCFLMMVITCRGMTEEEAPGIALFAGVFFLGSLLSVPVPAGPRTHLLLTGLVGVVLGVRAFPAILVGCAMQALLFAHGGPMSVAVNSLVMGLPAVTVGIVFRRLLAPGMSAGVVRAIGFGAGLSAIALTILLHASVLLLWGQGAWSLSVAVIVAIHLPLMAIEGVVSAAVVGLVWRARPAMLGLTMRASTALLIAGIMAPTAWSSWHRLEVEARHTPGLGVIVLARFSEDDPAEDGEVALQDADGIERHRVLMVDGRAVLPKIESGDWLVRVWASGHYGEAQLNLDGSAGTVGSNAHYETRLNIVAAVAGVSLLLSFSRQLALARNQASGENPVG
jgi:cobalt/nickel transport system permease protein